LGAFGKELGIIHAGMQASDRDTPVFECKNHWGTTPVLLKRGKHPFTGGPYWRLAYIKTIQVQSTRENADPKKSQHWAHLILCDTSFDVIISWI
jgi:hypothetical protein